LTRIVTAVLRDLKKWGLPAKSPAATEQTRCGHVSCRGDCADAGDATGMARRLASAACKLRRKRLSRCFRKCDHVLTGHLPNCARPYRLKSVPKRGLPDTGPYLRSRVTSL
jgi:hypothetical protein